MLKLRFMTDFLNDRQQVTSIRFHVTVAPKMIPILLRVDPVLPVSFGVSWVPDVLTGMSRRGLETFHSFTKEDKKTTFFLEGSSSANVLKQWEIINHEQT